MKRQGIESILETFYFISKIPYILLSFVNFLSFLEDDAYFTLREDSQFENSSASWMECVEYCDW